MSRDAPGRQGIDRKVFGAVIAVISDRLGREFSDITLALYHRDLSARLTTDAFQRGAAIVATGELYSALPSVEAFVAASRAPHAFDPVPDVRATARALAAQRALPAPGVAAVDAFAADWRRELAECEPKPAGLPKAYALARAPLEASPWHTATARPEIGGAIHTHAGRTPPPRPALTPIGDVLPRVLAEFAPPEESDVDAR